MSDVSSTGAGFKAALQGIQQENQATTIEQAQNSAQLQKQQAEQAIMTEQMTDNNKAFSAVTKADQSISY